jgi:hypothetical protein
MHDCPPWSKPADPRPRLSFISRISGRNGSIDPMARRVLVKMGTGLAGGPEFEAVVTAAAGMPTPGHTRVHPSPWGSRGGHTHCRPRCDYRKHRQTRELLAPTSSRRPAMDGSRTAWSCSSRRPVSRMVPPPPGAWPAWAVTFHSPCRVVAPASVPGNRCEVAPSRPRLATAAPLDQSALRSPAFQLMIPNAERRASSSGIFFSSATFIASRTMPIKSSI